MTKQSKPAIVGNIRVKPMSAKLVEEIDRRGGEIFL